MGRTFLAVVAGVVVAWLVIVLSQIAGAAAYPPPPGLDVTDPQQLAAFIGAAPPMAMAFVVAGYVLAALLGGWVAARTSRSHARTAALLVGLLVLAGVIANMAMIPHPLWMILASTLLPLPAAWFGAGLARPRPRST